MEIINDVLDFSKIESGKLELNIEEIDLVGLASQVIASSSIRLKNIDLLLAIDSDVSQFIFADAVTKTDYCQLDSECLKMEEGSIQLTIKEIASDDDAISTIKFSVKDTGMGMKQNQEKIFILLCKKIFLLLENLVEQV
jgi:signal transduction histidine kinase